MPDCLAVMKDIKHMLFPVRVQAAGFQPSFPDNDDGIDALSFLNQDLVFRVPAHDCMRNEFLLSLFRKIAE